MANSPYDQSSAQAAQVQSSDSANTAEYTANGQWTNHYTQSQFTEVNRAVPSSNGNAQSQAQRSYTSHSTTNTDSMTPMDRWAAETPQQAPWNAVGSFATSSNDTGSGYSNNNDNHQQQAGDDWSICGNKSTR
ncbi:uncharacterized protein EAE98_010790 [Botrytis deweyae]|uniref:Uncharacterized protein n=1 Tax=Botrytis deweyae TaxID=2478750 RepID=A0ABQ7I7T3_9HELO|nr:uncharacterized protein EAE98_010790 [Botrytis deweyae]KAF7916205.1 hypothetical protein EAE98_010790 [Botrytis deweyae]